MKHTAVIEVVEEQLKAYEDMLPYGEKELTENSIPRLDNIKTWETKFDNGYNAEVKVNTSEDDVWTEAVLFDEDWNELCCTEVCDNIRGDWRFDVDGDEYVVTVKAR